MGERGQESDFKYFSFLKPHGEKFEGEDALVDQVGGEGRRSNWRAASLPTDGWK